MKKLALALVCLVSVAFFASCDPTEILDPTPYLTVKTDPGYVSGTVDNPTIIALDDETNYKFGFHAETNASTKKGLSTLKVLKEYILANGEIGSSETTVELNGVTSYDFEDNVFEGKAIYDAFTVRATVTDEGGQSKTVALAYKVEQVDALPVEKFKWERYNGANGTGLEKFGLEWNSNVQRAFYAVINPLSGAKLYNITNTSEWDNIVTAADKADFFSKLPEIGIGMFKDIVIGNTTPNFVLATKYNGENYLIHITKTTATDRAWDYTIEGEYK